MTRPLVLLISYAYPPLAAPESWLAAKAVRSLQLRGVDVEVVHASPAWWHKRDDSMVDYGRAAAVDVHSVVTPSWIPLVQPVAALRQFPDVMRLLQRRTVRLVEELDPGRFDALITWSQWHSVHLVGRAVKRRWPELRWLAHFSDPWVQNPLQKRHRLAAAVNRRLERSVLELADVVEFTTVEARDRTLEPHPYAWRDRTAIVPHAFDPSLFEGDVPPRDEIILRYVGSFYGARRPDAVLSGLAWAVQHHPRALVGVRLEVVGGIDDAFLRSAPGAALPPGLVRSCPAVGYRTSLQLMSSADALLLIDAPATTNLFLASKLIDYIGADRPVIGITPPGTAAELVARLGGWTADPSDVAAVGRALVDAITAVRAGVPRGHVPEVVEPFTLEAVGRARVELLFG